MTIKSVQFQDIYFDQTNGLAESRFVFLQQNGLPEQWQRQKNWTILETGFGTGLNCLAAWQSFEHHATSDQKLRLISIERYPLDKNQIAQALSFWSKELEGRLEILLNYYPQAISGWHHIHLSPQVELILILDDVNRALPEIRTPIDCWFLDGFAPAKNPDMWSPILFQSMKYLSAPQSRFATFTAAGFVRRGLEQAGFAVERIAGYGHKRHMSRGVFLADGLTTAPIKAPPEHVAIIGAGLAGVQMAHHLQQEADRQKKTLCITIYDEKGIATGASGNKRGLFNPKLTAFKSKESDFYGSAYADFLRRHQTRVQKCGALHLAVDTDKQKRFQSLAQNWEWGEEELSYLSADQASDIAGVTISHEALYLKNSGFISPYELCHSLWQNHWSLKLEKAVINLDLKQVNGQSFDHIFICCGSNLAEHVPALASSVQIVRGQVGFASATPLSSQLKTNLCYGGYLSMAQNGDHVVGSTFQHWLHDCTYRQEDEKLLLEKCEHAVPALRDQLHIQSGWVGLRSVAKDRFPIGGFFQEGVSFSCAHGSHGILSSGMIAKMVALDLFSATQILPLSVEKALSAHRFLPLS
jgi:tRNA 5-methylaminomethyl-2-thiouridine biosynthesis bifunctional protein